VKRFVLAVVLALVLPTGCDRSGFLRGTPAPEKAKAAAKTIESEASAAASDTAEARDGVLLAADTVGAAARAAQAIPEAAPWAGRLVETQEGLARSVVPRLDSALRHVEAVRTAVPEVDDLVATVSALATERDRWQKEAAREKDRADSAVRKWLLLTAAGGFAGLLAGGALFVWLSRKAGLVVGLASLAVFAVSIALYRWFEWFAWGGLALILLAVAALGYGLWRNRHAFMTLVEGGQDVKAAFADGVQYTKDQIRDLFNTVHAAAQTRAGGGVAEMVADVKEKVQDPVHQAEE
jgi:hypothetical protein